MRTNRLAVAAAAGTCAALLLTGPSALAGPSASLAPAAKTCMPQGETGLYLSKEGSATVTLSDEFLDGLKAAGLEMEVLEPLTLADGGRSVTMPIGEKYDNIELPSGKVCYPGGFRFTNKAGDAYVIDLFWVKFAAFGKSRFLAEPTLNGKPRPAEELTMVTFSVPQALTTGTFVPHNDGIGPKRVVMTMTDEWAGDLNDALGSSFEGGKHWADVDIAWKGVPSLQLPAGSAFNPNTAGLRMIQDAIENSGGLKNS